MFRDLREKGNAGPLTWNPEGKGETHLIILCIYFHTNINVLSFTQIVLLEGEINPQVLEVVRISWLGRVLGLPTGLFVDV